MKTPRVLSQALGIIVGMISGCSSHQADHDVSESMPQGSPSELEWVLLHHQTESPYVLDKGQLAATTNPPAWIFQEASGMRQKHHVPSPPQTADGFQYSVVLDKLSREYWLIRSGGYGGKRVVFGPGVLPVTDR